MKTHQLARYSIILCCLVSAGLTQSRAVADTISQDTVETGPKTYDSGSSGEYAVKVGNNVFYEGKDMTFRYLMMQEAVLFVPLSGSIICQNPGSR